MASRHVPMAAGQWVVKRCSAGDAAAGGEVPPLVPVQPRAKLPEDGSRPPEGWVNIYEVVAKLGDSDPFGVKKAAAIDKMLQEAKLPSPAVVDSSAADSSGGDSSAANQPCVDSSAAATATPPPEAAAGGGKGRKYRLSRAEISNIIVLKPEPEPITDTDYLDDLAEFFPAEWIAERKRAHARFAEHDRKMYQEWKEFRQEVIKDLKEKGYYEVDEEYYANREKIIALADEEWKKIDFSGLRVATEEEELQALKEGSYRPYALPDEDDDLLDELPSDDEDLIFRGFHGA